MKPQTEHLDDKNFVAATKKERKIKPQTEHLDDKNVVAVTKKETKENDRQNI